MPSAAPEADRERMGRLVPSDARPRALARPAILARAGGTAPARPVARPHAARHGLAPSTGRPAGKRTRPDRDLHGRIRAASVFPRFRHRVPPGVRPTPPRPLSDSPRRPAIPARTRRRRARPLRKRATEQRAGRPEPPARSTALRSGNASGFVPQGRSAAGVRTPLRERVGLRPRRRGRASRRPARPWHGRERNPARRPETTARARPRPPL